MMHLRRLIVSFSRICAQPLVCHNRIFQTNYKHHSSVDNPCFTTAVTVSSLPRLFFSLFSLPLSGCFSFHRPPPPPPCPNISTHGLRVAVIFRPYRLHQFTPSQHSQAANQDTSSIYFGGLVIIHAYLARKCCVPIVGCCWSIRR